MRASFAFRLVLLIATLGAAVQAGAAGVALDEKEAAFLAAHPVWRLAGASTPPFQWMDAKGEFRGIAADYRALLEQRLGVKFEVVPAASWPASLEQMRRRECDVSLLTSRTPEREAFLAFTAPLLELPPAIITRTDDRSVRGLESLAGRRVVVARGFPIEEKLAREHPEIVLLAREDVGSALSAVALGDAEAYVGDLASATHAIERMGVRNLKVAADSPYSFPFRIAVRRDWPEAVSMLEKAIATISPAEQAALRRKWIAMEPGSFSVQRALFITVPLVIALALLHLLAVNRRLARLVTRQRETEAALRASEQRWSFALEGARDGVWDWKIATGEIFFSKRWKAMLGFGEEELPDRLEEWTKRIHPEDLDRALHEVQRHLRGEVSEYEVEHRVLTASGEYCWVLARGRIVARNEAGQPTRMVGTHTDVTERKRSELALQSAKEFAEELIETANAIVIGLDTAGTITIFNQAAEAITGYAKEEMLGANVWEVLVPRSRFPEIVARIGPGSGSGLPKRHEHAILTKSGEERFIVWQNGLLNEAGRVVGSISFGIDITQRRRAEEELRRHEEQLEETVRQRTEALQQTESRLRTVTDNLPGAVYQFVLRRDGSFAFTFCSEGFEKMTGVPGDAALRDVELVWNHIHPDDLRELDRRARLSAATMTRYVQDLRLSDASGRRWWIRAESEPQQQADGTTLWNGNMMDITERKRLEEELAIAKAAAESANRAKSAFLANMSHEIRTPLNAILGFSRLLLREETFTGAARQNLETIHRSGEHLLVVINDILEISKIEAGRLELREGPFALQALFEDLERMFRLRAEERRLQFSIVATGEMPPCVLGDEARLRQVFINLIGNAVKFTERGEVRVRVALRAGPAETVRLRAEVSDTGPGIAPAERPRLFGQFEQTAAGQRSGGGTGLGLAISREFVRLMGGEIQVESEVGHGSTFTFEVTLGLGAAGDVTPPAEQRPVLRVRGPAAALRILIADDQPENIELLQQTLRAVGFETHYVRDGQNALAAVAAWQPRLVLMDLRMPGWDGLETIRRIRQTPEGARVAIIAVTASVFADDRQQVFAAGGDDFLGKPFLEPVLFEKIKRLTGVEYEHAAGAPAEPPPPVLPLAPGVPSAGTSAALRSAALAADLDRLLQLIDELAPAAPEMAAEMRRRVERFDYRGLLELLAPEPGPA